MLNFLSNCNHTGTPTYSYNDSYTLRTLTNNLCDKQFTDAEGVTEADTLTPTHTDTLTLTETPTGTLTPTPTP